MSYKEVYVISHRSLWKVNESEYTTENFTPDENGNIKLETGWILHGADPRQVTKKFKDCFLYKEEAYEECKRRNEALGFINTQKKDNLNDFMNNIKKWKKQLNQECSIWYHCTIFDKSKDILIISNKIFRFIDYINGHLKIGYVNEPNSILNVNAAHSIEVSKLGLKCGGYKINIGDYIIFFISSQESTIDGSQFLIKNIVFDNGSYKIIPFER